MTGPSNDPTVEIVTDTGLAATVSAVASATFPLACPPHTPPADIAAFVSEHLDENSFRDHIVDPDADVLVVRDGTGGPVIGYSLVLHRIPTAPEVAAVVTDRPVSELSKIYVLPEHHSQPGVPPSHALMTAALDCARRRGSAVVWLGVNQGNVRAQKFYAKTGFDRVGVRTFTLGDSVEHDYVFRQSL